MKFALHASFAAALLFLLPQLSFGQNAHPCKADRDKFCAGIKAGDGKLGECMKQHEAELSPECAAERKQRREAWKNVRASCKEEAGKYCADVEKGHGRVKACLESHMSELGQPCADALKKAPGGKQS